VVVLLVLLVLLSSGAALVEAAAQHVRSVLLSRKGALAEVLLSGSFAAALLG
jgi:hypothetical protein